MKENEEKYALKRAVFIGGLCSAAYLAVYIAKNILSVSLPKLIENGESTNEKISALSSVFFIVYAVGQLINGMLGDRMKERYMVASGLILAGMAKLFMVFFIGYQTAAMLIYGIMGFALSMVYAPMVRCIAENTSVVYAQKCNLALEVFALFGGPAAGLIGAICGWKLSFGIVGFWLIFMGIIFYFFMSEWGGKEEGVKLKEEKKKEKKHRIYNLLKRKILFFTLVTGLTGVVRSAVVFWMPAYFSQYLGFSSESSSFLFSMSTICISMSAFVAVWLFDYLQRNMERTIFVFFLSAMLAFLLLYFVRQPLGNVICITFAVMASNCVSSIIWIVYCPSLKDTGMVSTATGYLDFVSYMAASVFNIILGNTVAGTGWKNLILIWVILMGVGVSAAFWQIERSKKEEQKSEN